MKEACDGSARRVGFYRLMPSGSPAPILDPPGGPPTQEPRGIAAFDPWFAVPAVVAMLVFAAIVTQGTGRFFEHESLGSFYDAQARSLLHGRLDVPPDSIQLEGFFHAGKWYGYFGPTPALLRLPFALLGIGAGQLTRVFLLGYFGAALIAANRILREIFRQARGGQTPPPLGVVLFTLNVGLGSSLLFLSSRAYVYHEAILCGVAFALWSVAATLRYWRTAQTGAWIAALVCGVLSVQARPPAGLFALTCLFFVAVAHGWLRWRAAASLRESGWVAFAAVLGVLSFNGVGYLKFGTFEGCPLRLHVQYTPERLAAIGGRQFHIENVPYGAAAYLGWHAHLERYFPYVELSAPDPRDYPRAQMDLADGTLGLPFSMAGLTLAAGIGLVGAFRRVARAALFSALVVWSAVLPLAAAMFMAVAVAHRYTADFCPFLIAAAAFGIVALDRPTSLNRVARALLGVVTVGVIPLTIALTLDYQGARVWGVPSAVRERYANLRRAFDHALGAADPRGYDPKTLPAKATDGKIVQAAIVTFASKLDQATEGISVCRALAEDFPEDPSPRLQLALLLCSADRMSDGAGAFEELLRRFPAFAPGHYYAAVLSARAGRMDDAVRELETAIKLDPRNADYRQALATLSQRLHP